MRPPRKIGRKATRAEVYVRGCQTVESQQQCYQPEYGVEDFDGEFHGGKEQREQAHVPGNSKRPERAEIPAVLERDKAEGDDDREDGLLVHVPS